jgi:hypothetical protein
MKIGKAHRNVRSANRRCKTVHDIEKSSSVGVQGGLVRHNCNGAGCIGAPIYWRTDVPLRQ